MARDRLTFRQRDVTAAIKAVKAAGETIARIEIHKGGGVTVVPGKPQEKGADDETVVKTSIDESIRHALDQVKPAVRRGRS